MVRHEELFVQVDGVPIGHAGDEIGRLSLRRVPIAPELGRQLAGVGGEAGEEGEEHDGEDETEEAA